MDSLKFLAMRHAKSSWKNESLSDFQRPLNGRGRTAAPLVAQVLREKNLVPELVISSSAERARQTSALLLEAWVGESVEAVFEESLYLASPQKYLAAIGRHGTQQKTIMVVGHNPGIEHLIEELTGQEEIMPTAAVAIISIEPTWQDLSHGQLLDVIRPKDYVDRKSIG